jgi:multidrug efflux pump subunit AcrB
MNKFVDFFLKRQTLFWAFLTIIVTGGVYAYMVMPKLEDPLISVKQVMVITYYPGASAHEVELEVTEIMEEELRTINNISDIRSTSSDNLSMITVNIDFSVPADEIEQRWDILRRKVANAASRLPSGAMAPVVVDDVSDIYGIVYSLRGEGYSHAELERYAQFIKRELIELKGVRRVSIYGTREECIDISLPKELIARNSIYATQIMSTVNAENQPVDADYYDTDGQRLRLDVGSMLRSEQDIQELIMQTPSGQQVKLNDIATVSREYVEPQTYGFWYDGQPALAICVSMEPDAVVTEVGKRVEARMTELSANLPAGFEYDKVYFQPDKVDSAIQSFIWNLISSVVIVVLILMLTMGFRGGAIIGVGLVLTVLASFPVLMSLGVTLQRISLGAFIVAMGMLVDNAVVVLDGIMVDIKNGLPPEKSLFRTVKNTALPLLGATLIGVITFLPIGLSDDTAGEYARDLFLVLGVSLLMSWVLALSQIPVFAKWFLLLRPHAGKGKNEKNGESFMHRFIRKALNLFMRHKLTTFVVSAACLLAAVFGFTRVKMLFFPDFDYNQLYIEYTLPPQTHPDRIKHDILEITEKLSAHDEIKYIATSQGSTPARYCLVRSINSRGDNYGELILDFHDYRTAYRMLPAIQKQLREEYPDAYVRVRKYNFSVETSHTVEALFSGPDPRVLRQLSEQAKLIMRTSSQVDAYSVCDNWQTKGKTIYAGYAGQAAKRAGVTRGDVANALKAATGGLPLGVIYENDKSLLINLKVTNSDGSRIMDLNDIPVWSPIPDMAVEDGEIARVIQGTKPVSDITGDLFRSVPLSQVADAFDMEWEETDVSHYNGQRAIEVQCDPAEGSTPDMVLADITKEIENIELPEGYSVKWLGEQKLQSDAMANIFKFIPLTIILILTILLLLFNDIRKLLLILCCLPFAVVGISPALLVTGTPFTFMAILGAMGLMGMMIKNSIVLVDEITRLTKEGMPPYDAIINSTVNRTRPVVMASATTILGMLPLVTDPMYSSLALVVIAGLTVGTVITLILLPIFYALLFRVKTPVQTINNA